MMQYYLNITMEENNNHLKYIVNLIMNYGYTKEEAINILDGKNYDGSEFIQLPF